MYRAGSAQLVQSCTFKMGPIQMYFLELKPIFIIEKKRSYEIELIYQSPEHFQLNREHQFPSCLHPQMYPL